MPCRLVNVSRALCLLPSGFFHSWRWWQYSFETSLDFNRTIRPLVLEDRTPLNLCFEKLKSNDPWIIVQFISTENQETSHLHGAQLCSWLGAGVAQSTYWIKYGPSCACFWWSLAWLAIRPWRCKHVPPKRRNLSEVTDATTQMTALFKSSVDSFVGLETKNARWCEIWRLCLNVSRYWQFECNLAGCASCWLLPRLALRPWRWKYYGSQKRL
jgi:hypothetical protein